MSSALWAVVLIETSGLGTLAVDKWWRLYYDPAVIEEWTVTEIAGVLYHEVCHLLRDHPARAACLGSVHDGLKSIKWNFAADCETNDDLVAEGVMLPGGCLLPGKFDLPEGRLAEEYYSSIPDDKVPYIEIEVIVGTGADGDKDGDKDGGKGGKTVVRISKPKPGSGACGSCASGRKEEWELDGPEATGVHGIGKADADSIRLDVARRIEESVKQRGNVPQGWQRWAEQYLTSKVDWRRELPAAIRGAVAVTSGCVDYTYTRPSRRQILSSDVIMPSMRRPLPRIGILIDTSGSMGDKKVGQCLAETQGVLRQMGLTDVVVLFVDAAVHSAKRVFSARQLVPLGGGGTDMRVGIEHARRLKPPISTLVVLTDAETPWPDRPPPEFKLVIGRMGKATVPSWAKVIDIDIE